MEMDGVEKHTCDTTRWERRRPSAVRERDYQSASHSERQVVKNVLDDQEVDLGMGRDDQWAEQQ